uniref:ACD1 n=1 Tax=Arundo donax TaxID=35708 RepID=A0A0A9AFA5_ARUDO
MMQRLSFFFLLVLCNRALQLALTRSTCNNTSSNTFMFLASQIFQNKGNENNCPFRFICTPRLMNAALYCFVLTDSRAVPCSYTYFQEVFAVCVTYQNSNNLILF